MLEIKDKVPLVAPDPKVPQGFFRSRYLLLCSNSLFPWESSNSVKLQRRSNMGNAMKQNLDV